MSPRGASRKFPLGVYPDGAKIKRALDAAQPFVSIDLDWRKHIPPGLKAGESYENPVADLHHALISFDTAAARKPYTVKQRQRSVRRVIDAFGELRDALAALDYPTQHKIRDMHDSLGEQSRCALGELNLRFDYGDFTQRYWRESRAWIDGLGLLLNEPIEAEAPNEQTSRDRLIEELRELFSKHGKLRRTVHPAEQEKRFITAVLDAAGAKPVADPARRVRALSRKRARKPPASE